MNCFKFNYLNNEIRTNPKTFKSPLFPFMIKLKDGSWVTVLLHYNSSCFSPGLNTGQRKLMQYVSWLLKVVLTPFLTVQDDDEDEVQCIHDTFILWPGSP